ncbi:MAG: hydrogenase expression/formation protein HypE [Proteobacteria bacterium]|nr:hydrogenase expression/formation protein HypE [Pseudomonadota bacterium]MBU4009622.1 hydrogenase expression/formation protein HypE [Pseudomonadota bacterium]MBU4035057.1 hydrogenase expression/formation protein HypE [Pseudomonadota bacterium]
MVSDKIILDHGSGGRSSQELIEKLFLPRFGNSLLNELNDSAVFELGGAKLAFTTDSFVVDPIFFPGGDIGSLAICGTVNDLSMRGARPSYLSVGFIIEEGFLIKELEQILFSMEKVAFEADIQIVTGDTKVVPKGAADKIFINTSGIGLVPANIDIAGQNARPGDAVLISGTIADHGITILSAREGLFLDSPLKSDASPLNHLVQKMLNTGSEIHVFRDPTRGGLATTLNEIAIQSQVAIDIYEEAIPINESVLAASEILGLDPLYMANEGKLIAIVPQSQAEAVLAAMRETPYGRQAALIGQVKEQNPGKVVMHTTIGGKRIIDMLTGEQLPRIC